MGNALRAAVPLPQPHGPSAADRLRKAITDAGSSPTIAALPVAVAAGVLEELEGAQFKVRAAEQDARAARETTRWAKEKAAAAEERAAQLEAQLRSRR